MEMFGNIKSLAYYDSNKDDPYITLNAEGNASDDDEREELQILATDNLLLAAKVEDEMAHLEVYVYEDAADNLYVHHDIMLPAIPLLPGVAGYSRWKGRGRKGFCGKLRGSRHLRSRYRDLGFGHG